MNLKLNLRIFIFYVALGIVPFIALSWISLAEYAGLVGSVTEQKIAGLLHEAKTNTEFIVKSIDQDLNRLAEQDDIRRAFSQFLTAPPRVHSLKDKLEQTKMNSRIFQRISLYSKDGQILADTADNTGLNEDISVTFKKLDDDIVHKQRVTCLSSYIRFTTFKRG